MADVLSKLRKVPREEAANHKHDAPIAPSNAEEYTKEMQRQIEEEAQSGHPAWQEVDDE